MRPLRVRERTLADGSMGYSVDGSPTDAVSLAFLGFFEERFDLVASGINYGANLGDDITYSGTVSAAMEGVINNCPSFAISQEYYEQVDFALASLAAAIVARNILEHGLKRGELLSVNVGGRDRRLQGLRSGASGGAFLDQLVARVDPRHPLLLAGRPPPSGISVGHRLQRGGQPACRSRRSTSTSLAGACCQLKAWDWSIPDDPGSGNGRRPSLPPSGADAAEEARIAESHSWSAAERQSSGGIDWMSCAATILAGDPDGARILGHAVPPPHPRRHVARPGRVPACPAGRVRQSHARRSSAADADRGAVVWLSTVRPDGLPASPSRAVWWDGEALLVFRPDAARCATCDEPAADGRLGHPESTSRSAHQAGAALGSAPPRSRTRSSPGTPRCRPTSGSTARPSAPPTPGPPHRPDPLLSWRGRVPVRGPGPAERQSRRTPGPVVPRNDAPAWA
jgi:hypothetical protein